ncbi:hypothetical protein N7509_000312 [Penicillium cosmopolitanum]|uniref:Uncharacterized protein n=1 Tax=Penicillium cosmopolitanum TaxID=1131564 RepID=A0A9W9WA64_9EURO|nr:uncharacterized protein N7509_000312 [Penicillium cosmopolitanum]KAJ5413685.1 hypothetical protein N7509_000312 [Penicillium cosmopolitanum]
MFSNNSNAVQIKPRLITFFLATAWLAAASLSSIIAHCATLLLDRATHDIASGSGWILDIEFKRLMNKVFGGALAMAIISALLSTFGTALLFQPRLLSKDSQARAFYGCIQLLLSFPLVCIEDYLAGQVRGFQSPFKFFTSQDYTPYYEIMYYGATCKAIFGTLVTIFYLVYVFACH